MCVCVSARMCACACVLACTRRRLCCCVSRYSCFSDYRVRHLKRENLLVVKMNGSIYLMCAEIGKPLNTYLDKVRIRQSHRGRRVSVSDTKQYTQMQFHKWNTHAHTEQIHTSVLHPYCFHRVAPFSPFNDELNYLYGHISIPVLLGVVDNWIMFSGRACSEFVKVFNNIYLKGFIFGVSRVSVKCIETRRKFRETFTSLT